MSHNYKHTWTWFIAKLSSMMFHEFRQTICDVVDDLSHWLPIVESCRDEEKKTVASLFSQMCELHDVSAANPHLHRFSLI